MNVVDSSGWLEYFADAENADFFADSIERTRVLIVPTVSIYEVYKHVLREKGASEASQAVTYMKRGHVVGLDASLATRSARTSHELRIPMADSIILTTARSYEAELWTQDADFQGVENVHYIAKSE